MDEVGHWLEQLGLGRYAEAFTDNAIDFDVLSDLTDGDLERLGVLLGHRKKLLKAIAALSHVKLTFPLTIRSGGGMTTSAAINFDSFSIMTYI